MLTQLFIDDYKERKANVFALANAHLKGWSYNDWALLGITCDNERNYLSTRDYCSLHPFNGIYSSWIDDKLTLKYILHGTAAGNYMPEYYFQIFDNSKVLPLMDIKDFSYSYKLDDIADLLQSKGRLAFKLIRGSFGQGFYKAKYDKNNTYWLNNDCFTREEFIEKISELSGYIVTELLLPHPEFARYCDKSVGCLRYIVGRDISGNVVDIYSFMRIGTIKSNFVENFNAGGVLVILDLNNGYYKGGYVLDFDKYRKQFIESHPDNNIPLLGYIPNWNDVVEAAHMIADVLPQMSYLGIDFCITHDNKIKIIEINSLTSLDSFQLDKSIFETPSGAFFRKRLYR